MMTFSPDADSVNADWTKATWDLPPYRSPEFMENFPDLDAFRKTPAYTFAVAEGLIHDDEWVADWCQPAKPQRKNIHIHIEKD